jgi:ferric-dicitrate binding protein FerR (iron transport regulator)
MKTSKDQVSLLRRYVDGLYTKEEANRLFIRLKQSVFLKEVSEEMNRDWLDINSSKLQDLNRKTLIEEANSLLNKIKTPRVHVKKRYTYFLRPTAYIAIFLLLIALSISLLHLLGSKKLEMTSEYIEATTSTGEKKDLVLPDGTSVTLNACSMLKYPKTFNGESRQVELKGEAFFNVSRKKKPFIINTRLYDVKVLGTKFNIKIYEEDEFSSVSVESGKVQLDMLDAMVRLTSDECIILNTKSGEMKKEIAKADASGWRSSNLIFYHTPIGDVANALERKFNCSIKLSNVQNNIYMITGELSDTTLVSAIQTISFISGLHYTIDGNNVEIMK